MRTEQWWWNSATGWSRPLPDSPKPDVDLLLVFGAPAQFDDPERFEALRRSFPGATLFGCSTAGEIQDVRVRDDSLVATAVSFDATRVRGRSVDLGEVESSRAGGRRLASALVADDSADDLVHVVVLSDGLAVNGSELITGLVDVLPPTGDRVRRLGGGRGHGAHLGGARRCRGRATDRSGRLLR